MTRLEIIGNFLDKAARNPELNKTLAGAPKNASAWVAVAKKAGFDFTVDELRAVAERVLGEPLKGEDFVAKFLEPSGKIKPVRGKISVEEVSIRPDLIQKITRLIPECPNNTWMKSDRTQIRDGGSGKSKGPA